MPDEQAAGVWVDLHHAWLARFRHLTSRSERRIDIHLVTLGRCRRSCAAFWNR